MPLGSEPRILTTRHKEFPMSGDGYGLINIRVRLCSTVRYRSNPSLFDTLKAAGERTKITAPEMSGRHLALPKQNLFINERLTNINRTWALFN
ncbi:hypothetical protein AVEN_264319-1 [Araneus ventricosus]|uniref:Uncharacterized protein n=1 Tax=Araneus ventricosus TaxID=182803 RepID=A0A4Y2PGL5_ARAVE|nr:hypothetical protein AVEN_264319-1 [Araneus ventricosus]